MAFLSPLMLWGLGAILAPIFIHLWQRRHVTVLPFSTLRFLKIVAVKTRRSARLENFSLLFLRCLLFATIVMAACRPAISSKVAKFLGGSAPRSVIIAVDNSLSMGCSVNGTTRLEESKKQALAVLDDLKPIDEVAVIAAAGAPQLLIPEPTLDHKIARQMVEKIQQGEMPSDFPGLFRQVGKIFSSSGKQGREFYFFTDSQDSAWQFDSKAVFDAAWTKESIHTIIVRPDALNPPNKAVLQVKINSPLTVSGSTFSGVAKVVNFSDASVQEVLEIKIGDERIAQKAFDLSSGETKEVPFEGVMPLTSGRWVEGSVRIDHDNLIADDTFYFAIPVCQRAHVLVVEGQQLAEERLHSGYYLRKALQAGDTGTEPPVCISSAKLDETSLENYSAIFLADVPSLSDRALVRLDRYLQGGGTVVYFPGDLTEVGFLNRFSFLPAKALNFQELPAGRLSVLLSQPDHPLIASTWDKSSPFPPLPQNKMIRWKVNPDGKSLLNFSNGTPFVITAKRGAGVVFLINAAADRSWGDFPLTPAFLPLVQQIARISSEGVAGINSSLLVGESLPMTPNLPLDKNLTLTSPDGKSISIAAGERSSLLEETEQSGFYSVKSNAQEVLQLFGVNGDRRESNLKAISNEDLSKILPAEVVTGLDGIRIWLQQIRGNTPLWPPLLFAALIIFTCEAVLSNLLARNRSQGQEQQIKTGRLNKRRLGVSFSAASTGVKK